MKVLGSGDGNWSLKTWTSSRRKKAWELVAKIAERSKDESKCSSLRNEEIIMQRMLECLVGVGEMKWGEKRGENLQISHKFHHIHHCACVQATTSIYAFLWVVENNLRREKVSIMWKVSAGCSSDGKVQRQLQRSIQCHKRKTINSNLHNQSIQLRRVTGISNHNIQLPVIVWKTNPGRVLGRLQCNR